MTERAREVGAAFYGETTVTDLEIDSGGIRALVTDRGRTEADETEAGRSVEVSDEGEWHPGTDRNEPLFDADRKKMLR